MSLTRYATIVLGIVATTLAAVWLVLPPESRGAVLTGAMVASLNALAAYALALWAMPRPANIFAGAVLGGMVARMGVMLTAFLAAVKLAGIPAAPLAVSLLSYFVAFLLFELAVLHRRTSPGTAAR